MTVRFYLTTDLQTQNPHFLNTAANTLLTPARYLLGGRTVRILEGASQVVNMPESNRSWQKTALMIAAFIPGILFGTIARALSFCIQEVRVGFALAKNMPRPQVLLAPPPPASASALPENVVAPPIVVLPPPIPVGHLPAETVIDKGIAYFRELELVADQNVKAWLEKKNAEQDSPDIFQGAAMMEQSRAALDDLEHLETLLELYEKATERLRKLGLVDSATESTAKAPTSESKKAPSPAPEQPPSVPVPKVVEPVKASNVVHRPKPLSKVFLEQLGTIKGAMTPKQFEEYCRKCLEHDPQVVLEKLAEFYESKKCGAIQRAVESSTIFFMDLRDKVPDKPNNKAEVEAWLKAKKAAKNYPYPFYLGADCVKKREAYIRIVGTKIAVTELQDHYQEASKRLTKLGLQAYLNEKPPG